MTADNNISFLGMMRGRLAVCAVAIVILAAFCQSVDAGCGGEHSRPIRHSEFSQWNSAPHELELQLWVTYSDGSFCTTTTAPSKPCDGAGCGPRERMTPEPPLAVNERTDLSITCDMSSQSRYRELLSERSGRWELLGKAIPGFKIEIEHPPRAS